MMKVKNKILYSYLVLKVIPLILAFCGSTVWALSTNLSPKEKNGFWGYVNDKNQWEITPTYHYASDFNDGIAHVITFCNHNGYIIPRHSFINLSGDKILDDLDYASDLQNGYYVIGNRYGEVKQSLTSNSTLPEYHLQLMDSSGKKYGSMYANVLLPPDSLGIVAFQHHDYVYNFEIGNIYRPRCGIVTIDEIVNSGDLGIPASLMARKEAPSILMMGNDTVSVENYFVQIGIVSSKLCHPKRGMVGLNDNMKDSLSDYCSLLETSKNPYYAFQKLGDNYVVKEYGFYGLNNYLNESILPTSFGEIEGPYKNLYICKFYNGKYALFSDNGVQVSEEHDQIHALTSDYFLTRDYSGNWENDFYEVSAPTMMQGIIDGNGITILPPEFETKHSEYAIHLIGNTFWARKNKLWGVYDLNGELIVPHLYKTKMQSSFKMMSDNLIQATDSIGRTSIFDRYGRDIAGPIFARTSNADCKFGYQLIKLYDSNLYGIMRLDGSVSVKPFYEDIDMVLKFPIAKVYKKSKWGVIALNGEQVIQCKYDKISIETDEKGDCICQCTIGNNIHTIILDKRLLEKVRRI